MVLAVVAELDWKVYLLDVQAAFLNAYVDEKVYVKIALSYTTTDKDEIPLLIKLRKFLYGFAQSLQNWWRAIDSYLMETGFAPLESDTSVYIYKDNGTIIIFTLYVNDVLLPGGNMSVLEIIEKMMSRFRMTNMGDASPVLDMQIAQYCEKGTLIIRQDNYMNLFSRGSGWGAAHS